MTYSVSGPAVMYAVFCGYGLEVEVVVVVLGAELAHVVVDVTY